MNHFRTLTAAAALAVGAALPALAQDAGTSADAGTVVATVNGTEITLGHMLVLRERLPQQYQQLDDQTLFNGILEQLIQQTALGQSLDGLSPRGQLIMENEERALLASEVVQNLAEQAVTDEALQAAYDETFGSTEPEPEFNASHILVETEEEAQALIDELEGGADFAELAKEHSTGPSGPNGGELGWFGKGMMVPPFEEAVLTLEPGTVGGPVQTQFGWHVVRLNDTREKDAPSLDEVRDQLAQQIQQQAVEAAIADAMDGAEVTKTPAEDIDAALLRDQSLLD